MFDVLIFIYNNERGSQVKEELINQIVYLLNALDEDALKFTLVYLSVYYSEYFNSR